MDPDGSVQPYPLLKYTSTSTPDIIFNIDPINTILKAMNSAITGLFKDIYFA